MRSFMLLSFILLSCVVGVLLEPDFPPPCPKNPCWDGCECGPQCLKCCCFGHGPPYLHNNQGFPVKVTDELFPEICTLSSNCFPGSSCAKPNVCGSEQNRGQNNGPNCRKSPCDGGCPQPRGNQFLGGLDSLSPNDINNILLAPARTDFYMDCVLETGNGRCDRTGESFREALRDWASTKQICRACSPCQTRKVAHVINQLQRRYKGYYDAILKKYGGTSGK